MAAAARDARKTKIERPTWLTRVVEKLAVEYAERLTLDELSREAGVHPVHLSRVFRKFVGEGIGEHVHRLRVRAACEQMRRLKRRSRKSAWRSDSQTRGHFTRTFRRVAE